MKMNNVMGACVARRRAWGRGALAAVLAGSLALTGCAGGNFEDAADEGGEQKTEQGQNAQQTADGEVDWASLIDIAGMDFECSKRDKDASYDAAAATKIELQGSSATVSGEGAAVEGTTVTISAEGTYVVSGELSAGALVVNATDQDKVQVVLDGATIRNENGPALNIQQADKVFVTLAEGSRNTLADGESYELAEGEDEPNAALFSKDDLTLNGTGALTIEGNYRHGVSSKDDLVITGGAITVTAKEDGLRGKDCVKIADGQIAITAAGDGVKSSNDEDPTRGFVSIDGGTFSIKAGDEGMQAATYLRLAGGEAQIAAADHALRSDIEATMIGGTYVVEAGGKGMNPETKFTMDGGTFIVTGCEEGIEAQEVVINDGELDITASDDGINAALAERNSNDAPTDAPTDAAADESTDTATEGLEQNGGTPPEPPSGNGAPEGDFGGRGGMGGPGGGAGGPMGANASEDCLIQINGGSVTINAGGDAVDSNGYVEVTGGTLLGASSGQGDSALDYEYGATVSGGTVILAGAAGMAETFSEGSTQPFALVSINGAANSTIEVENDGGGVLASFPVPVSFQSAVVSVPSLTEGAVGKLVVGDEAADFTASTTPSGGMGGMGGPGGVGAPNSSEGSGERGGHPGGGPRGSQGSGQDEAVSREGAPNGSSAELSA